MRYKAYVPILKALSDYKGSDLQSDLLAGVTVSIMLVPQGIAYAYLAGMPPIYGLYAGLIPLILYAIFGTSRQLAIGPVAVSSLLVFAGVNQLATPGTPEYVELVLLTGLLAGVCQFLMGVFKMGFLVNFLSQPVIMGFTAAAAIIIGINQLKDILGIVIPRFELTGETFLYAMRHLGEANWIAVLISLGSMIAMLVMRWWNRKIPGALIVVFITTLLSWGFELESRGLDIVKDVPGGLPSFYGFQFSWDTIEQLIPVVLTVTIIGVVDSISIAKVLEARDQSYTVFPNQELRAMGISKIGGAFFQSIPTSGSFSRSAVNAETGGC